jgi:hypothetical protein
MRSVILVDLVGAAVDADQQQSAPKSARWRQTSGSQISSQIGSRSSRRETIGSGSGPGWNRRFSSKVP